MPATFLMQQMEWREALDDAHHEAALDALERELSGARNQLLQSIESLLDTQADAKSAAQQVRALMFVERFAHDVESRFEQLGQ